MIGLATMRPSPVVPSPALAVQARASVAPAERLPKELVAWPPGCAQLALVSAVGMTIGSLDVSFWPVADSFGERTGSRLPGRTTSFSPVTPSSSFCAEPQPERMREVARISQSLLFRMC
jgi:hypothetical protein